MFIHTHQIEDTRHEATGNSKKVKVIAVVLSALLLALSVSAQAQQPTRIAKIGWLSARPGLPEAQQIIVRMLGHLGYVSGKNVTFEFRYADNKLDRFPGPAAQAQAPKGLPQIGFLSGGFPSARQNADAFRRGLSDLGYVEGKNIGIVYRYGEGNVDRLPQLATELVRLNVNVILAGGTVPALAVKQATKTIPIVFVNVADPLSVGLVMSLARPGGNITGTSTINSELTSKRLGLLKESVATVSRVAFLHNPSDASNVIFLKQLQSSARGLGLTIRLSEVRDSAEFDRAFSAMAREGVNGLIVAAGTLTSTHRRRIVDLALKARIPAMYGERSFVEAGGLMSYAANFTEQYRRAAVYIDKILKGTKPADIPVEQPTKFELVINLKTAKQIGLTIPQSVLYQADKVIK